MNLLKICICLCIFLLGQLLAQEEDLKEIYKDVTRVINSALLTKAGSKELSGFMSYNSYSTNYTDERELSEQIILLEPVTGTLFAFLFLGEIPPLSSSIGIVIALCGISLASIAHVSGKQ